MKSFKDFLINKSSKEQKHWTENPISWNDSTHGELREKSKNLNESLGLSKPKKKTSPDWLDTSPEVTGKLFNNKHDKICDGFFHDVKAKEVSPEQEQAILHYTSGSPKHPETGPGFSAIGNSLLDESHKNNGKVDLSGDIEGHPKKEVWKRLQTYKSLWNNPNNTNHRKIITYSGIPHHIGEHFGSMNENEEGHIARNVSSSIHRRIAYGFAKSYWKGLPSEKRGHVHLAEWHIHPNASVPLANHSGYGENEVGLRYGTKISKIGSYRKQVTDPLTGKKITAIVHKMAVHPEHKELTE